MKRFLITSFFVSSLFLLFPKEAPCPWIWTPETGEFTNVKSIVKETPKNQFDAARAFEEQKKYKRAIREYRKLIKHYPTSSLAVYAQISTGECFEKNRDYYGAFKEYQKVLDNYPSYGRIYDIIEKQYKIGNLFLTGGKRRIWRLNIVPARDKAIEIFQQIIESAPFSEFAPRSQFLVGEAYAKMEKYSEAIYEYQKLTTDYPESEYVAQAKYQLGLCAYHLSRGSAYDQQATDKAITTFRSFVLDYPDSDKIKKAKQMILELETRKAQGIFDVGEYYFGQENFEAAQIYYNDLLKAYPENPLASKSKTKLNKILKLSQSEKE